MIRVITVEMELPDGLSEETIKAFLEDVVENGLYSPAGTPMWSKEVRPTFKVVEVT